MQKPGIEPRLFAGSWSANLYTTGPSERECVERGLGLGWGWGGVAIGHHKISNMHGKKLRKFRSISNDLTKFSVHRFGQVWMRDLGRFENSL